MNDETFICEKCKKEYVDHKAEWLDDDENEFGEHLWLVYSTCPHCGTGNYDEIWDDFHTDLGWEEVRDV